VFVLHLAMHVRFHCCAAWWRLATCGVIAFAVSQADPGS